jgi:hypothetical protein
LLILGLNNWNVKTCSALIPLNDSTGMKINSKLLKENAWNILELKISALLIEDGTIEFTYRKTNIGCFNEDTGSIQFNIGLQGIYNDEDKQSHRKTFSKELKKGRYDFSWLFALYGNYCFLTELVTYDLLQIKITPTNYAQTSCISCNGTYSKPGSESCIGCPANYKMTTDECTKCNEQEFSYPGENFCKTKPKCSKEYDVSKVLGNCINDVRQVTFKWREDVFCNKEISQLPKAKTEKCVMCHKGTHISSKSCVECPTGTYSDTENALTCKKCAEGMFAMPVKSFINITEIPDEFGNKCETINEGMDVCYFHSGWIAAKGSFTAHPYLPKGGKLILRKEVEVEENFGVLKVNYIAPSKDLKAEEIKIQVDGFTEMLDLETEEKTYRHTLSKGKHTIELIYEKTSEEQELIPAMITLLRIEGESGPSDYCASCQPGFYLSKGICIPCKAGYELNKEGNFILLA